ncbi:hypothetical protein [Bradyrhizobium sp. RD5-C2]|uniref:hypothetical protein n=1 Tax=Bradyrhizobium sp. RD5-C2 TaxID=244562 RepID=UPI001CC3E733|nr:hypothetical protein [Bradyrhizobium sp. RD5-C2]GIQ78346.1 hypothetical protein BraRD5C2_67960 [Bradyrhizobium sp. RD5-C2]
MKRCAVVYLSTLEVLPPLDFIFVGAIGRKLSAEYVGDMTLTAGSAAIGGLLPK